MSQLDGNEVRDDDVFNDTDHEDDDISEGEGDDSEVKGGDDSIEQDDVNVKYLCEDIRIIDQQGNVQIKTGRILSEFVHNMPRGRRIIVELNDLNQPIKKSGAIFTKYLGQLVRKETIVSIGNSTWRRVHQHQRTRIIKIARGKFVIPDNVEVNKMILAHCSKKWKEYKNRVRKLLADYEKHTKEAAIGNRPSHIHENVWKGLVDYWFSKKFIKMSENAKKAAACSRTHPHTTGSKSFARKRDEIETNLKRKIGEVEAFQHFHQRRDGTYISRESEKLVTDAIATIQARTGSTSIDGAPIDIQADIHSNGRREDRNGRVRNYGLGVTPSMLKSAVYQVYDGETITNTESDRRAELGRMNEVVEALQAQNQELRTQNQELKTQNQFLASEMTSMVERIKELERRMN